MIKKALALTLAVILTACTDAVSPPPTGARAEPGSRKPALDEAVLVPVYQADFNTGAPGEEWSSSLTSTTPNGERFLGEFVNDTVGLITLLPPHTQLVVTFDLYLIRSWDGTDTEWGPDYFFMGVDGTTLLNTTFSTAYWTDQNYPFAAGGTVVASGTGALASNSLGYTYWGDYPIDGTYRLSYTVNHTSPFAYIYFGAYGLQDITDESWGIDNVRISIVE